MKFIGYTDSDLARSIDDCKRTSGYVFSLGSGMISWSSRKQPIVALSTTEAEYIAASLARCHTVWLLSILKSLMHKQKGPTTLFVTIAQQFQSQKILFCKGEQSISASAFIS